MSNLPLDTSVQAIYEDGYILDESELADTNPWGEGNTFTAILNKLPEEEHGPMVSFSCFWRNRKYTIDWTTLPENARPIRFRHGHITRSAVGELISSGWSGLDYGAQWNDEDGSNQQEVQKLR